METKQLNNLVDSDVWYQNPTQLFVIKNSSYSELRKTISPDTSLYKIDVIEGRLTILSCSSPNQANESLVYLIDNENDPS